MLLRNDLLATFKVAPWKRPEELDAFVTSAEVVPVADLLKLLELILGRVPEAQVHRLRLACFLRLVEKNPDKSLFTPLVRSLRNPDGGVRALALQLLPKVNSPTEHAELCAFLRERDAALRQVAQKALIAIGGGRTAFELLSRALGEREYPGRLETMEVLVSFARSQAVKALLSVMAAGNVSEKVAALKHLADPRVSAKDPAAALKAILPSLQAESEPVLVQAISSFSSLCTEEELWESTGRFLDDARLPVVKAGLDSLRRLGSPRAIAALERRLRLGPRALRIAVLNTLEAIGSDAVLPPLVAALGHKQIPVRTRAAEVMQKLSLEKKLDLGRTVIWLLRSRDVNVRRMAAEMIRSVPDPDEALWPKLLLLLRDEDWWVRERVMDALIELGGLNLTRHLVGYLTDGSDVVRRFAVRVLARLRDPRGLRALIELAQKDLDWWVRETAVEAIATINDPRALPYLVQILQADEAMQPVCLQALIDLKALPAAPAIAALLKSENPDVRLMAVKALDALDAQAFGSQVSPLQEDFNVRVRTAARDLLGRWSLTRSGAVAAGTPALDRFLLELVRLEGDDLLIAPGKPVFVKRLGKIAPVTPEPLTAAQVDAVLGPHLLPEHREALARLQDVDFSHEVKSEGLRFRANVFREFGGVSAVFRRIRGQLPEFEKLGLPDIVRSFGDLKNGLVLVGGPTGSGKSTTLAAIVDYINRTSSRHIICLEDPIEVVHQHKLSLVNQREIGTHTRSFAAALRSTLRQDPNVILVGEVRDLATIGFTVIAAETGHLVFGTVPTVSAATTVDRLISAFPAGQQEQVRSTLAESLRAVVCQYLLKDKNGPGRTLAAEVLLNNEAVANLIRKGKSFQLPSVIAAAREQGMQLMDSDLLRLCKEGKITAEDAYMKAVSKKDFEGLIEEEQARSQKLPPRPLSLVS